MIPIFEIINVNKPNSGDKRATLIPPAMISGLASPVASSTSNPVIIPRNAEKKPIAKAKVPQSFISVNILFESSGFFLRL